MKRWEYILRNCEVCGADIPIHGAKGNIIEPPQYKMRKACNNPVCQNTLRHPPAKKLIEKPCEKCGEPIPLIWPNRDQKKQSQYDRLQFCSRDCKVAAMFLDEDAILAPKHWKALERDAPIDVFIYAFGK